MLTTMQFPEILKSQSYRLSLMIVSRNAEVIHCGIPINMPNVTFAGVSVQDNAPTNPSTQRVRKFVIMASCVCITIGLAMSTGLLIRCVRSGNCDEFANHWKKHWRFHTNTTASLHAQ